MGNRFSSSGSHFPNHWEAIFVINCVTDHALKGTAEVLLGYADRTPFGAKIFISADSSWSKMSFLILPLVGLWGDNSSLFL